MNQSLLHNINNELTGFYGHSLAEMNNAILMDRVDSKFVVAAELLPLILPESRRDYSLLDVDGVKHSDYLNVYFDTEDFNYYHSHHNGKLNRTRFAIATMWTQEQPSWKLNLKAISREPRKPASRFLPIPALL